MLTIIPKDRMICGCEATFHPLFANCLNCGRIVCEQEGKGPCFTCQMPVISIEQRKRDKLYQQQSQMDIQFASAMQITERMVQRTRSSRYLKLYDDELDYFGSNSWVSADRRKANQAIVDRALQHKEEEERKGALYDLVQGKFVEREAVNVYQELEKEDHQEIDDGSPQPTESKINNKTFEAYLQRISEVSQLKVFFQGSGSHLIYNFRLVISSQDNLLF